MQCPNCHTADKHTIKWDLRNLATAVLNALNSVFLLGFWPLISVERVTKPARSLRRVCLHCGHRFLGERPEVPDFDVCAQCEYNLRGNVSGRCPECGWKLPRRFRAYRRIADRQLRHR